VILVMASAPIEFVSGWLGWWGGENPARPMVGTFYWHNPYAAFLVPGGLLGLALWVWHERLFAFFGLVCFTFACVGIVFSTSRASLATFAVGFAALTVFAVVGSRRVASVRQLALTAAIGAGATYLVSGPPFFSHRASPLSGEQARAAGESLAQNGGYRLDFWRQALGVFRRHPLTGGGYKSMVAESVGHVHGAQPLSPFAHNGYLQALADGGLLLALPFLLAVIGVVALCLRSIIRSLRTRDVSIGAAAVPIALGCVLLHSAVDFDWAYPADFAMAGILAGLVLGHRIPVRPGATSRPARLALLAGVLAGVALLGVSAWVQRDGDHHENLPVAGPRVL
jgi:O-antigen ligase